MWQMRAIFVFLLSCVPVHAAPILKANGNGDSLVRTAVISIDHHGVFHKSGKGSLFVDIAQRQVNKKKKQNEGVLKQVHTSIHSEVEVNDIKHLHSSTFRQFRDGFTRFFAIKSVPSLAALALGCLLLWPQQTQLIASILVFFGAQTFMNIYMKTMMTEVPLDSKMTLKGVPAASLITVVQQCVSFAILLVWLLASRFTRWQWKPTMVTTRDGWMRIGLLSVAFACNIAGNNTSMSLLPISVNLTMRACAPLTTLSLRFLVTKLLANGEALSIQFVEVVIMCLGTSCSLMVVTAKSMGIYHGEPHMALGIGLCACSLFAASSELIIVSRLSSDAFRLAPSELVLHTALPIACLLIGPALFIQHPVSWGGPTMTDWAIFKRAFAVQPLVGVVIVASGFFSLAYNLLLYSMAQKVSPEYAALCSNFNKIATCWLSVLLGLEKLPAMPWTIMFWIGCVGCITCFGIVSKLRAKRAPPPNK